ncbi:MAG: MotA/TolQ/ExbB proton channel family protein [Bacteroidetes bacterium]|jgi:biopolymer transport protein ExbB|nr:MotA/TolQ/ExbB proton channel family protein [Bacteroidota bacterium]
MSNKKSTNFQAYFTVGIIIVLYVVSYIIFDKVMGAPHLFENNDRIKGHPVDGNILGTIYKGGFIVPILMTINLIILTFTIERAITILRARGTGNVANFIRNIRQLIENNRMDEALAACDRQKGSIGNVVRAGLTKYRMVEHDSELDKEQKLAAIQKDLEETTALELPMLSKNLVILSTCASIATLVGLIGTVLGMIRAFSALASSGAPDSNALATGISEALINTAFGITGSAIAIIVYNMYTTLIDRITYGIDEANFSILQTFSSKKHN